jgi:hypothetical protein
VKAGAAETADAAGAAAGGDAVQAAAAETV